MRKTIALLAVLIGAFGVLGLAGASPASAASCTAASTGTTYSPQANWNIVYVAILKNCTSDVDKVRFRLAGSGWHDYTLGGTFNNATLIDDTAGDDTRATANLGGGYGLAAIASVERFCWYVSAIHSIDEAFTYQIHNSTTNVWTTNLSFIGTSHAFAC